MKIFIVALSVFSIMHCVYGDSIDQFAQGLDALAFQKKTGLITAEEIQEALDKIDVPLESPQFVDFYNHNIKQLMKKALQENFNLNEMFQVDIKYNKDDSYAATLPLFMIPLLGYDHNTFIEMLKRKPNLDLKMDGLLIKNKVKTTYELGVFGCLYYALSESEDPESFIDANFDVLENLLFFYNAWHKGKNISKDYVIYNETGKKPVVLSDLIELFLPDQQNKLIQYLSYKNF